MSRELLFLLEGGLLLWFYPWIISMIIIISLFVDHRKLLTSKKNKKYVVRESIGELKYLIPVFNWIIMVQLISGKEFISAFIKDKLERNLKEGK